MHTLKIYGDEAGQMPLGDDDGPFVAATVAVLDSHPDFDDKEGKKNWLVETLQNCQAQPHCSIIQPFPGYGDQVRQKLERLSTLARTTRLLSGANAMFLDRDGINFRNFVWAFCMQNAVQIAFFRAVVARQATVENIDIVLDQKTLTPGMKRMLEHQLAGMADRLIEIVQKTAHLHPSRAAGILSRCRTREGFVTLKADNKSNPPVAACGLDLAHYLASLTFKDLRKPSGAETLASKLDAAGYTDTSQDMTARILAPIASDTIQFWEQKTGLQAPK